MGMWDKGTGRKVWKNIRLDINKYEQYLAKEYTRSAERQLGTWERAVEEVLSDPLPKQDWHRPRPLNRRFPYMNTGKQINSIHSGVNFKVTGQGNYSITAWGDITTPYSQYTSLGFRRRKDGKTPNWVGWMDDVFKGTRGFNSIEDIFSLLTLERAGLI